MEGQTTFDSISQSVFGFFDRINQGISTYFDGRIAVNEQQARLAYSEAQKDSARTIADLERGSAASNWSDPDTLGVDLSNPQTLLIGAAVLLVAVAALRGK